MFLRSLAFLLAVTATLPMLQAADQGSADKAGAEAKFPAPVRSMELSDGDCVVFLGDSITHQCLYTQYVEDFFYTRFPGKRFVFHNAGVGGAKAWDALARFDRDVAAYKPKYVTILLGMNDGSYQPFNQAIFDTYQQDMSTLIDKIHGIGAIPVLMTPTMFDARADRLREKGRGEPTQEYYNSVLAYYGTWLRDVAQRRGFGFVDMWSPLNNITIAERANDPKFTLIADAIHPGANGQLVMAYAILDDMGLRGPISQIRVDVSGKKPTSGGRGGKVTDFERTDSGLQFTWTAESLPLVVPEEAQLGAKLLKLGHKASREALTVVGLPAGKYALSIDGTDIGEYTAAQLAGGVELEENEKTPQYQQALKVAELNQQRNAGPVRNLRNLWSKFQGFARSQRDSADGEQKMNDQIAGMEEAIKQAEAAAKELEDQIYEVNQPKPHRYELKSVSSTSAAINAPARKGAATISGMVVVDGKPLKTGTIEFVLPQGKPVTAKVTEGSYKVQALPIGEAQVRVNGKGVASKYAGEQSALKVSLKVGTNTVDFSLAP